MTPDEFLRATWPIAIVQPRYWRGWVAVPQADAHDGISPLDDIVWGDDIDALDWRKENLDRIGMGPTPEDAYADLEQKWGVR